MTNIVWFPLYEVPRVMKFIETESRMVIARGWGKGEMDSYCLMGTEFQFGKMTRFWRWLYSSVDVLNATELKKKLSGKLFNRKVYFKFDSHTFEKVNFMLCIFYHNNKKKPNQYTSSQTQNFRLQTLCLLPSLMLSSSKALHIFVLNKNQVNKWINT